MNQEKFIRKLRRMFNVNIKLNEIFEKYSDYLDDLIDMDEISFEQIKEFIVRHHDSLLASYKHNIRLQNMILYENEEIRRDKTDKLTDEYYEYCFKRILEGKIDDSNLPIMIDIADFMYIYGLTIPNTDELLISGVYTASNVKAIDGRIIDINGKRKLSNTCYSWYKRFGNKLLPYLNEFKILAVRIQNLTDYADITELYATCLSAIHYLNSDEIPTKEEVEKINKMFDEYQMINNSILCSFTKEGQYSFLHFVQTDKLDYHLEGNRIVNRNAEHLNDEETRYNESQNNFMLREYILYVKDLIEQATKEKFDYGNLRQCELLEKYLIFYNKTRNNRPLDRLPIPILETYKFKEYVRPSSSRVSASFFDNENVHPHLNRMIALELEPIDATAIISISDGYTSQKDNADFKNDQVNANQMLEVSNSNRTNEIALDSSKCRVTHVIVFSEDEEIMERANEIASAYNVDVIVRKSLKMA